MVRGVPACVQPMGVSADLSSIVEAGALAPSADNRHCFEVEVSAAGVLLLGSTAFLEAPYHRKLLSLISFGAVGENMRIRALRLGYRAALRWIPDPSRPSLMAELHLTQGEVVDCGLDAGIRGRHTNRRLVFSGPRLSEAELGYFHRRLEGAEGVSLCFLDSAAQRPKLLRLMRIAEAERFNTRVLHEELFAALRFDAGWRATVEEGLPPGALGVEPGVRWAFAQLRRWPLMNALRRLGVHHALGFRAASLPCRLAPHCGVLTASAPTERSAITIGVVLQRLWLEAESRGLAFQPFAAPALLALQEYSDVPAGTGERLRHGWNELTDATPMMVFRMGYAPRPAVRAGRPPIERWMRSVAEAPTR